MKKNNSQSGFTIVELLVTVGLFVIIITIAVGGFTNAIRTQRQVSSLISAQSNVSLALEQMARQIRTGYLFCHDPAVATPSARCNDPATGAACAVDPVTGVWKCPTLDFYDAESNHVNYSLQNGQLIETGDSVTGNAVRVRSLTFVLHGQTEGDNWSPLITISLGIAPSSSDPAVANDIFTIQTTVSARTIDCSPVPDPITGKIVC